MGDLSKRKFIICKLVQCCWNYQMKEDVLNRTCDKYGREEKCTEKCNRGTGKGGHLEKRKRRSNNKNIAIDRKEVGWKIVGRVRLLEDIDQRRTLDNTVTNFQGTFLTIRMSAILPEIVIMDHVNAVTRLIIKFR